MENNRHVVQANHNLITTEAVPNANGVVRNAELGVEMAKWFRKQRNTMIIIEMIKCVRPRPLDAYDKQPVCSIHSPIEPFDSSRIQEDCTYLSRSYI